MVIGIAHLFIGIAHLVIGKAHLVIGIANLDIRTVLVEINYRVQLLVEYVRPDRETVTVSVVYVLH